MRARASDRATLSQQPVDAARPRRSIDAHSPSSSLPPYHSPVIMSSKLLRTAGSVGAQPTETESTVINALVELENAVNELKTELRTLHISAAKEVDVKGGKKAIVVFVPMPELSAWRRIQGR